MAHRSYPAWLLCLYLTVTGGCAQLAVRPPTPAKDMDVSGLWEPPPGEHFYVTLFASQSTPRIPQRTHSWATVVHVIEPAQGQPPIVESHTISWLPVTLEMHPWRLRVEKGRNLDLHETLAYALANGECVSQWGPYECRPELYYRSLVQKEFLESGRIGYQAFDIVGEAARTGDGCDCIHAMTDMDPRFSRSRYPLIRIGDAATRFVVREVRKRDLLIDAAHVHSWLDAYLGLEGYPIVHRR
jgi:hypothetical protein